MIEEAKDFNKELVIKCAGSCDKNAKDFNKELVNCDKVYSWEKFAKTIENNLVIKDAKIIQ